MDSMAIAPKEALALQSDAASGAVRDDARLVAALRDGDEDAFTSLVADYQTAIYNLAWRLVRDREDARDIAQEVFLKAYRQIPKIEGDLHLWAWLYRVTVNACLDHLRAGSRRPVAMELRQEAMDSGTGDGEDQAELTRLFAASLAQLSTKQQAALLLKDVHGLPHSDIAATLGISRGSSEVLLFRARRSFRHAFTSMTADVRRRAGLPLRRTGGRLLRRRAPHRSAPPASPRTRTHMPGLQQDGGALERNTGRRPEPGAAAGRRTGALRRSHGHIGGHEPRRLCRRQCCRLRRRHCGHFCRRLVAGLSRCGFRDLDCRLSKRIRGCVRQRFDDRRGADGQDRRLRRRESRGRRPGRYDGRHLRRRDRLQGPSETWRSPRGGRTRCCREGARRRFWFPRPVRGASGRRRCGQVGSLDRRARPQAGAHAQCAAGPGKRLSARTWPACRGCRSRPWGSPGRQGYRTTGEARAGARRTAVERRSAGSTSREGTRVCCPSRGQIAAPACRASSRGSACAPGAWGL